MAEETNSNPNIEETPSPPPNPNAGEARTPSVSQEQAPSTDVPESTSIPSASAPDPQALDPEVNPDAPEKKPTEELGTITEGKDVRGAADKTAESAQEQANVEAADTKAEEKPAAKKAGDKAAEKKAAAKPAGEKAAAKEGKAKKEKPPAPEDKPFTEFIEQDYLPALKSAFAEQGVQDVELTFAKQKIPIAGLNQMEDCWQVMGSWKNGGHQFNVYFPDEDINKQKAFSWSTNGAKPSTLESFMIDERKVTLDLLVFYTIQRLNAQKWLVRN